MQRAIKRLLDILLAVTGLVILSPVIVIIAILVRLKLGQPILFRQQRPGLKGRPFTLIKFRTMIDQAEAQTGPVFARPDDSRVTAVGRVLRRTSLDELPQLLNVLFGQMSLVGPRPERPEFVEQLSKLIPRYMLRHHVKAGLTGWGKYRATLTLLETGIDGARSARLAFSPGTSTSTSTSYSLLTNTHTVGATVAGEVYAGSAWVYA